MARNFLQYPFAAFQGNFSSKAFNDTQGTQHLSVLAAVGWSNYSIGGAPLGLANPNFSVLVNLNAAGPNTVSQTWQVISVYIDNEAVNFPVYLYFPDTQFSLSCPANSSGWFRVFTLGRQAYVTGLGISNQDIANNAVTNVFFTDAFSVPYLDQENPTAVDMRLASPSFSLPGSNGGVQQIDVIIPGSTLASGALSITGGGGSGAAAHAVLDQFGRVTQVLIDNPGSGYQGPPNVTAVGGFNPPPTWTSGQAWAQGQQATDVGGIFIARQNIQAETFPSTFEPSSTNGATYWEATGINVDVTPQFSASVAPISGGTFTLSSGTYAAAAMGDRFSAGIFGIGGIGIFGNGFFGTPLASGYIYITNFSVLQIGPATGQINWVFEDTNADQLMVFQALQSDQGIIMNMSGMNVKIPATIGWRFRSTTFNGANIGLQIAVAYTYSQI